MDEQPRILRKSPLWIKIALGASILLNLAMVGVLGGLVSRMGQDGIAMQAAFRALPDAERRALGRDMGEIWRGTRSQVQRGQAHQDLIAALREPDFDAARFARALRRPHDLLAENSLRMQDKLVERVSAMSPEARLAYADALARRAERRPPRWRGDGRAER
jgi:uncharacterized membrane protein